MSTLRFKDLKPKEAIQVIDSFIGNESIANFTEKLAGQNFIVTIKPDGNVSTTSKKLKGVEANIFPHLREIIKLFHPKVTSEIEYTFEVLKKQGRPDYIDYVLQRDFTLIEFSGNLTQSVTDILNSSQEKAIFYTKQSIKKSISSTASPEHKDYLEKIKDRLLSGERLNKSEMEKVDIVLSTILDQGGYISSFGGRIEGLFGDVGGTKFKVPSKRYSEIQKLHSGIYGSILKTPKRNFVARFVAADTQNGVDRLVDDTRKYLEKISTESIEPGFRIFFKPSEARRLLTLSNKELAEQVYDRVSSRNWVKTSDITSESKTLLRTYIRNLLF